MRNLYLSIFTLALIGAFASCKSSNGLFTKKSPREKYEDKAEDRIGKASPVLNKWRDAGEYSLKHPYSGGSSYFESGFMSSADSTATAFFIPVKRGQKVEISFQKNPSNPGNVFMDLWRHQGTNAVLDFLESADTLTNRLNYIAKEDMNLVARFQGEINFTGNYFFHIYTGPSLVYPIKAGVKAPIISVWGDGRDGGARKHEGIDIGAPKFAPIVASADGVITNVTDGGIGGKTVSLRPDNLSASLYHAHLDSQYVREGQRVKIGDVLGTVGNTGNAQFTVAHLHFGIYMNGGAVDPINFVKPIDKKKVQQFTFPEKPAVIVKRAIKVYTAADKKSATFDIVKDSELRVKGITDEFYRVALADGRSGFILKSAIAIK